MKNNTLELTEEKSELRKNKLNFIIQSIDKYFQSDRSRINIIDLGCGAGFYSFPLFISGYKISCIDLSRKNLNILKKRVSGINYRKQKNIKLYISSIEKFETKQKFDVVLCTEVLEHVDNPKEIIKKANLLLKKNGLFITSVPNGYGTYEIFFDRPIILLRKLLKIKTETGRYHINFFTFSRIKSYLTKGGFELINVKKGLFFPIIPFDNKVIEKLDIALTKISPDFLLNDWVLVSKKIS